MPLELTGLPWGFMAYLDPGSGSLMLQGILGGIAAVYVFFRVYWRRVKSFFTGKQDTPQAEEVVGNSSD